MKFSGYFLTFLPLDPSIAVCKLNTLDHWFQEAELHKNTSIRTALAGTPTINA